MRVVATVAEMLLKDDVDAVLAALVALPWFVALSNVRLGREKRV